MDRFVEKYRVAIVFHAIDSFHQNLLPRGACTHDIDSDFSFHWSEVQYTVVSLCGGDKLGGIDDIESHERYAQSVDGSIELVPASR